MCPICTRCSGLFFKFPDFSSLYHITCVFFSIFCRANDITKDTQTCARIQIEFDTFVLRASNYIYLSRFLGAWQYLVILPFSELHISTTWKLYYMLTSGFSTELIENVSDGTVELWVHICI